MQLHVFQNDSNLRHARRWGVVAAAVLLLLVVAGYQWWSPSTTSAELPALTELLDTDIVVAERPVRLVIPAIGVDAPVQSIGLTADGQEMAVPDNFTDVGWYELGVRPGMSGSAVMAGHLNGRNTPEAVFYDLHTLQIGDEVIVIDAKHAGEIFVVTRIESYDYDDATADVFISDDGKSHLNLITCGGAWLVDEAVYDTRIVVFTEQVIDGQ